MVRRRRKDGNRDNKKKYKSLISCPSEFFFVFSNFISLNVPFYIKSSKHFMFELVWLHCVARTVYLLSDLGVVRIVDGTILTLYNNISSNFIQFITLHFPTSSTHLHLFTHFAFSFHFFFLSFSCWNAMFPHYCW